MVTPIPHAVASCAGLLIGCLAVAMTQAATDDVAVDGLRAGGDGAGIEDASPARPAPATPTRRSRAVFVCRGAVPVIFADRPCGQFAETLVLQLHEPAPGRAASVVHAPPADATRPRTEPQARDASTTARDERCRRLRTQRERLDDRMRSGYSAREAAQLWNRWREVDAQIYAARC
jgi:hypothetical protein